jgi:ankyrin repeat protein
MDRAWRDAARRGDLRAVRAALAAGTDPDARDRYGQTALMLAAYAGQDEVVAALVAAGARLDVTAKYGLSALMLAILGGHVEIARALRSAGADPGIRGTGPPGFAGKSALDLARERGMRDLARELERPVAEPPGPEPPAETS